MLFRSSLFDQVLSFSGDEVRDEDISALLGLIDRELLLAASRAVAAGDALGLLELVERLSDYGADHRNFARELILHFREILLLKTAPDESALLAPLVPEERERLRPLAEAYSEEDLLRILEVLTQLETDLRWAQDPRVTLELALLKMVQMRRLVPFAELVERVERLAAGAPAPRAAAPSATVPVAPSRSPTRPAAVVTPPSAPASSPPASSASGAGPASPADGAAGILAAMIGLAATRPSLAQPLRGAHAQLDGETLRLDVAAHFATLVSEHADDYRELARKAAGRPLKVQVGVAPAAEAEAAPAPAEAKKRRLMEEAAREPAVQEALDLFGGKVVEVRENKP